MLFVALVCLSLWGGAADAKKLISNENLDFFVDSRRADTRQGCIVPCGNASVPYGICNLPERCGPGVSGCGCNCPACPSCVVAKNPPFTKACNANVLLILDASYSIDFFNAVRDVQIGASSFWTQFAQVNQIGGVANLAVMQFATNAEIVRAGQPILEEMRRLDATWLQSLNNFIDPNIPKPPGYSNYNPGAVDCNSPSCTNWDAALTLAKNTQWCVYSDELRQCVPTIPDIIVWFTDGAPTILNGTCDYNCNANRVRADNTGLLGPGKGGDLGGACYHADQLKAQGTKIFVVGVGQAALADSFRINIETVSGNVSWVPPQAPDLFPQADYVIDPDYSRLGAIFYNVARGLCKCLQDQSPCREYVPPANSTVTFPACSTQGQFDARLKVTAVPGSRLYPANSVTLGWMYYSFSSKPPVYAVEVQFPGSNFSTPGNIAKTDLFDACAVQRKEICVSGCVGVSDKSFLPRFFISANDTQQAPTSGLTSTCGVPYRKFEAPEPESILYIWLRGSPAQICAARSLDGTLYEFFEDNLGLTPGVNYRTPINISSGAKYDFNQFANCPIVGKCGSSVDLVYVVDWQFDNADYDLVKEYIVSLISSYNYTKPGITIRAGIYFNNPSARIPSSGWQSDLSQLITVFNITPKGSGPTDFYSMVTNAINSFWPSPFVPGRDSPRYMITMIGGPDSHGPWSSSDLNAFRTLKSQRGVESWAIAVASGATQLDLVNNIADRSPPAAYEHLQVFGSASILRLNAPDQALRMCPTQSLCSDTCQGLCVCGECLCPECTTFEPNNTCLSACCDATSKLCAISNKATLRAPIGCVPVNASSCTKYTCSPSTGQCGVDTTCSSSCGCPTTNKCQVSDVNTANCAASCSVLPVGCGCGNQCGSQCNPVTGLCGGAKVCNDNNACTADSCVVRLVGSPPTPTAECVYSDLSLTLCPRGSPCTLAQCLSNVSSAANFTCQVRQIPALLDICGTCNGSGLNCSFATTVVTNGPLIAATAAAGLVAAALAAAIAATIALRPAQNPANQSPLQDQALNNNPAFVTPGLAGDMPAVGSV